MKENILGYDIEALSVRYVRIVCFSHCGRAKEHGLLALIPHSYAVTMKDEIFSRALKAADWLVPDGVGVCYWPRAYSAALYMTGLPARTYLPACTSA